MLLIRLMGRGERKRRANMVNWEEKTATMELKTGSRNSLPLVSSPTRSLSG